MRGYEAHVTIGLRHAKVAGPIGERLGWKTSQIARDAILGDDTFFYFTRHSQDGFSLMDRVEELRRELRRTDVPVLREKIEAILYDTRA